MWVIKLGGSLLSSGRLNEWLSIIIEFGKGKLVIVPGGGCFADQVREAQKKWKFDDKAAHQMALLAMEQTAYLLKSVAPDLSLTDSTEGIEEVVNLNKVPVWLPCKMIDTCQDITSNWNVTSDSLALWLAGKLNAEHTMLVKSLSASNRNARQLSDFNMVDKAFPEFVKKSESGLWWLEEDDMGVFKKMLKTKAAPEDCLMSVVY
jgi:aspartokinase-like uncharacterized kinase